MQLSIASSVSLATIVVKSFKQGRKLVEELQPGDVALFDLSLSSCRPCHELCALSASGASLTILCHLPTFRGANVVPNSIGCVPFSFLYWRNPKIGKQMSGIASEARPMAQRTGPSLTLSLAVSGW